MDNKDSNKSWPYPTNEGSAIIEQAVADIKAGRESRWKAKAARLMLAMVELKNPRMRVCRAVDQACEDRGYRTPDELDAPLQRLLDGTLAGMQDS